MSEILSQSEQQDNLHATAYVQIHKYLIVVLPLLEARQDCAKRIIERSNITDKDREAYEEIIRHYNEKISEILYLK